MIIRSQCDVSLTSDPVHFVTCSGNWSCWLSDETRGSRECVPQWFLYIYWFSWPVWQVGQQQNCVQHLTFIISATLKERFVVNLQRNHTADMELDLNLDAGARGTRLFGRCMVHAVFFVFLLVLRYWIRTVVAFVTVSAGVRGSGDTHLGQNQLLAPVCNLFLSCLDFQPCLAAFKWTNLEKSCQIRLSLSRSLSLSHSLSLSLSLHMRCGTSC